MGWLMTVSSITRRGILGAGVGSLAVLSAPNLVRAQSLKALKPISLLADWVYGGPNAGLIGAKEKGFFADAGFVVSRYQG